MDKFYLVEERAVYRRRYVLKNPPATTEDSIVLSSLVDSSISVELPEGYVLEGSIKDIKYKLSPIDLSNMDSVTRQCVSNLTSLDNEEEETKVKRPKVKVLNTGQLNSDKVVKSVEPKKKRAKTIDWGKYGKETEGNT